MEIAHGGVAYKDVVDHRGPVTYYLYALAFAIGGDYNMLVSRMVLSFLIAITCWIIFKTGAIIDRKLGLWTAISFCLLNVYGSSGDFLAFHTEWPLCFFIISAYYFLFKSLVSNKYSGKDLLLVGVFLALAVFSKQVAAFDILALGLTYVIVNIYYRSYSQLLKSIGWIGLGGLMVTVFILVYFTSQDSLPDFIFYTLTYNSEYYMQGRKYGTFLTEMWAQFVWLFISRKLLFMFIITSLVVTLILNKKIGNIQSIQFLSISVITFIVVLAATCLSGRPFGHYLIQIIPYLSFILGIFLFNISEWIGKPQWISITLTVASLFFYYHLYKVQSKHAEAFPNYQNEPIFEYINMNKSINDRLFIWGFNAEPYVYTKLRPASRFSFCNFQTGLIPFVNKEPYTNTTSTIVPGSRKQLLDDLKKYMPRFIIDSSPANYYFYGKYPLTSFPELDSMIRNDYRRVYLKEDKNYPAHLYQRIN